ncbi:MAG: DUF4488 domain-containing protein, partial [Bacteroidota bacterium]
MLRSHSLPVFFCLCAFLLLSFIPAEDEKDAPIRGAWMLVEKDQTSADDLQIQMVKILSDGHFMFAFYNAETQQFFSAGGGTYTLADGKYTETIDFHTIDPNLAGRSLSFEVAFEGDKLMQTGDINGTALNEVYQRIDDGTGSELIGTWMQESVIDEKGKEKRFSKKNKKLKILSATRFQWVEYNAKSGKFVAAGGGEYALENDGYVETLHFFSPDSTVVGSDIAFNKEFG